MFFERKRMVEEAAIGNACRNVRCDAFTSALQIHAAEYTCKLRHNQRFASLNANRGINACSGTTHRTRPSVAGTFHFERPNKTRGAEHVAARCAAGRPHILGAYRAAVATFIRLNTFRIIAGHRIVIRAIIST